MQQQQQAWVWFGSLPPAPPPFPAGPFPPGAGKEGGVLGKTGRRTAVVDGFAFRAALTKQQDSVAPNYIVVRHARFDSTGGKPCMTYIHRKKDTRYIDMFLLGGGGGGGLYTGFGVFRWFIDPRVFGGWIGS